MAVYHLTHHFLRRSSGASSISKAAYNTGEKLDDDKGVEADFTHKGGVLFSEITFPTSDVDCHVTLPRGSYPSSGETIS